MYWTRKTFGELSFMTRSPFSPLPCAQTGDTTLTQRLVSLDAYRGLVMFLMMAEVLHSGPRRSRAARTATSGNSWPIIRTTCRGWAVRCMT